MHHDPMSVLELEVYKGTVGANNRACLSICVFLVVLCRLPHMQEHSGISRQPSPVQAYLSVEVCARPASRAGARAGRI